MAIPRLLPNTILGIPGREENGATERPKSRIESVGVDVRGESVSEIFDGDRTAVLGAVIGRLITSILHQVASVSQET